VRLEDFDFDLPEELIATRPARPRSSARLMVAGPDWIEDRVVNGLAGLLRPGDRLVLNDTKVIPARLNGKRWRQTPDGSVEAKVEVTLLEPRAGARWQVLAKPLRKLRAGDRIEFGPGFMAEVTAIAEGGAEIAFEVAGGALDAAIEAHGAMPLPPYIAGRRAADELDRTDYQTIWARERGAVAAPTASLHFDPPLMERLAAAGISTTHVTLHVGAGTFLPVKVEDPTRHRMHSETGEVSEAAAEEIARTRAEGGRVIPVGTTALRVIETAAQGGGIAPWRGATDIFIYPGYEFRATDALMTNFHLPKSTLMMLVSALMGQERVRQIYAHAIAERYRFFSYGDASLLLPGG